MTASYFTMGAIIVLILVVQWVMPKLIDNKVPFGVRIPPERVHDPAVHKAYRRYYFGMAITTALSIAVWFFLSSAILNSFNQPIISLLPLLPIALGFLTYYAVHRTLQQSKRNERWMEGHRQVIAVETNIEKFKARVSLAWALPTLLIIIATFLIGGLYYPNIPQVFPIHFGADGVANRFATKSAIGIFSVAFIQVGTLLLMGVLHVVILRTRESLDPADPSGSAGRLSRRTARLICALWIMMACFNLGMLWTNLCIWGAMHVGPTGIMLGTFIPNIVGIACIILAAVKSPISNSVTHAEANSSMPVRRDDDANWFMGVFYVSRDDPRFLVAKRFGIGWTINLANPVSWAIVGVIILAAILPRIL
jgi:uncharacterized membrane protein